MTCSSILQDAYKHLYIIYKFVNIFSVHNNNILVVEQEKYWTPYQGNVIWNNENMRRKKKDRPKNMRIETNMDMDEKMVRLNALCH